MGNDSCRASTPGCSMGLFPKSRHLKEPQVLSVNPHSIRRTGKCKVYLFSSHGQFDDDGMTLPSGPFLGSCPKALSALVLLTTQLVSTYLGVCFSRCSLQIRIPATPTSQDLTLINLFLIPLVNIGLQHAKRDHGDFSRIAKSARMPVSKR